MLTYVLWPMVNPYAFAFYFVAVAFSAWFGGVRPAVFTVVASAVLSAYFFVPPEWSLAIGAPGLVRLFIFFLASFFIILLGHDRARADSNAARRVLQSSLDEAEKRFQLFADKAPVMVWTADTQNRGEWFNRPWLEFTGKTLQQELGRGWLSGIHPDDTQRVSSTLQDAFDARREFRMEFRLRRHDGQYRWVLDHGVPYYAEDGSFAGYMGSCVDIHDLKSVQQALQESEERFRAVADTAATAIYIHDGTQFVYVNKATEQITGLPADELVKKDLWELVHPDDVAMVKQRAAARMRGLDSPARYEYRILDKNGGVHWIDFAGTRMMFGNKPAILATALDVTARKQAEEAERRAIDELRLSEQRLLLANRAAGMGSWEWDITTNALTWTPEIYEMHGIERDNREPSFTRWLDTILAEDRERVQRQIMHSLQNRTEFEVEFRVRRQDGTIAWVTGRGKAFYDEKGQPQRMVGIGMDITHRKQSEEMLRTTEKLAATGRLAATIAHEINNPLEAVTNLLYLLKHEAALSRNAREYVRVAEEELARVTHITRQTLAFYRDTTQPAPVRLPHLLDEVLEVYGKKIEYAEARVVRDYGDVPPVPALAGELRQVFSNLVTNALDAMPPGGTLTIRVRGVRGGVRVTVADTGMGIAPADRKRIFEPFFTTKGMRGTGLGLWVTQGIVQKHAGRLRLRSRTEAPQRGTAFSVFLPVSEGSAAPPSGIASSRVVA